MTLTETPSMAEEKQREVTGPSLMVTLPSSVAFMEWTSSLETAGSDVCVTEAMSPSVLLMVAKTTGSPKSIVRTYETLKKY